MHNKRGYTLLIALALLWLGTGATPVDNGAFADLVDRHKRVMLPIADAFHRYPMKLTYAEGDPAHGKQNTFYWQYGKFRQEFHWLGFIEVFGYNGRDHWYGSNQLLPFRLDYGKGPDITSQRVGYFAYLQPDQLPYLQPAYDVPLALDSDYTVLRYAPPEMSEVLLLLDPQDLRLAGMLQGSERQLGGSALFRLTTYENWQEYTSCWYPEMIRSVTFTREGAPIMAPNGNDPLERLITTQSVTTHPPLADEQFYSTSAPAVSRPELPTVPFEAPFYYAKDRTVVLRCLGPDGRRYRLELDTGANVGLLTNRVARQLGLEPVGAERVTGHGGAAEVRYAWVEGFTLEGLKNGEDLKLPPWLAAVLSEQNGMEEALQDNGVSGLLSTFLLNSYVVKLDYRRRVITLYPPEQFDPERHLQAGYYAVPAHRDQMPYVDITVSGAGSIRGGAFFNTGSQQYFTMVAWAVEAGEIAFEPEKFTIGETIDGTKAFFVITPEQIQLGDLTITPDTAIDPSETCHMEMLAPGEPPNPNRIANFGNKFLEGRAITFDLFHEVIYLEGTW